MVYIHGSDKTLSPVLVNAHYDSVSTGYGRLPWARPRPEQG